MILHDVLCNRGSGGWRLLGRIDARLMQRTEPETQKEQFITEQLIQLFLPLRCPMRTWNWRDVANTPGARTCVESWKMLKAWHFRRWSDNYLYMFSEEFFYTSAGPVRGSHFQSILVSSSTHDVTIIFIEIVEAMYKRFRCPRFNLNGVDFLHWTGRPQRIMHCCLHLWSFCLRHTAAGYRGKRQPGL